jgi:hypothetical protein
MSQCFARIGEAKKRLSGRTFDENLDIKLFLTRKDCEYEYAQDPNSTNLFSIGNYLLALCGVYLFQAQQAIAGGGSITPITPGLAPTPYDFIVEIGAFIEPGATTKVFPSSWIGFNILFVRNHVTQSIINDGNGSTYYSWDRGTASLTLFNGAAVDTEPFQFFPV